MRSLWNDNIANSCNSDLALRVYSSNLLGRSDKLVLHGGGNTSIKSEVDGEDILFVKGSGWDLVSIQEEGFAPVKLQSLLDMAKLEKLSDIDMVASQKEAMINSNAPNPSVEAILHALIPFKVVDHTHADAIVTISNSENGKAHIKSLFSNFLIVPYVMPGFLLAQRIYEMTQWYDWEHCEGIILHNHGIFTFDNDAKKSYQKMIEAVSRAEQFLDDHAPLDIDDDFSSTEYDSTELNRLITDAKGFETIIKINTSTLAKLYASQPNLREFATRGVLTPEHIIRTKRVPLIIDNEDIVASLNDYIDEYKRYFKIYAKDEIALKPTPNYAIIKGVGVALFGKNEKEVNILNDIIEHTMIAVLRADKLGGYESISISDSFEMEYWELEQIKLRG
ncbi:MAG: class II aldolase/adducin family protein [Sulfurovum sp.]